MARVALVTCSELAELADDDRLLLEPLAEHGAPAEPVVWDASDVDWTSYDLAVLRSTWDYPKRREQFLAWADSAPALANPAEVVRWNTDKSYLHDLHVAGVPVVPTTWICPGDPVTVPSDAGGDTARGPANDYVVKPSVSAGAVDTGRYRVSVPHHAELARRHVERLLDRGATVMIQPYLTAVDAFGETAMLFVGGELSHAVRKGPVLDGPDRGVDGLFRDERITPRVPSEDERKVADQVLSALPAAWDLLYARVDLIPDADGAPMLLELELTEPSLFLDQDAGAAQRFADAIAARC